jgi:putative Ca2+/H+ antiporter (TMEM165/GDT1 family)
LEALLISAGVVALGEMGDKTQLLAMLLAVKFRRPVPIILGIAMAGWMLVPDKIDADEAAAPQRFGVFGTTVIAFFLAEMGDKTQIATVALAARFQDLWAVVAGTTLGMMLADVPAVFVGDRLARKIPMKLVHGIAAAIFAGLGLLTLFNVGNLM